MIELSMREMMQKGVHFGHMRQYWNPEMEPYIFGIYQKLHIINLELTKPMLMNALSFIEEVILKRGKIVFVGTKYAAQKVVSQQALRCDMPYVDRRWLGGTLTNFKTIRRSVKRLKELEEQESLNTFAGMTKKERLVLQREQEKLEGLVGGIKTMETLPGALFVLDVGQDAIAVKEANKLGIPVIGIVDTNNSPAGVDYVIPGNDDAMSALEFYASLAADVILSTSEKMKAEDQAAAKRQAATDAVKPVVKKAKRTTASSEKKAQASDQVSSGTDQPASDAQAPSDS